MKRSPRKFSLEFKKKVVLEALKEQSSVESLATKYELAPSQISSWKTEALANFEAVFQGKKPVSQEPSVDVEKLYSKIGQLNMELEFLKKSCRETCFST